MYTRTYTLNVGWAKPQENHPVRFFRSSRENSTTGMRADDTVVLRMLHTLRSVVRDNKD